MNNYNKIPQGYIKSLKIIHLALVIGQIMFLVISVIINRMIGPMYSGDKSMNTLLFYVVPLLTIGCVVVSMMFYKSKISQVHESDDLDIKLSVYRSANIIRFALLETPSFLAILAYLFSGNWIFLMYMVIIVVFFFVFRPTIENFSKEMKLK